MELLLERSPAEEIHRLQLSRRILRRTILNSPPAEHLRQYRNRSQREERYVTEIVELAHELVDCLPNAAVLPASIRQEIVLKIAAPYREIGACR